MGLRFRKSVKLPLGLRVNFSKTGIGTSWGFKGYRVTKRADGKIQTTSSIPGTGISWVDVHNPNKSESQQKPQENAGMYELKPLPKNARFCTQCGKRYSKGRANFCSNCGAQLEH